MKVLTVILIGFLFISCSSKSDKEVFEDASKYLKEDRIAESIAEYEKLILEFPESQLAPQSISQLAAIYHSKKDPALTEQESLTKADSLFYSIYLKYPESEQAPLGLFMAGFIQANELNEFQRATNTYNAFLEKYSDHDLAVSAKEELENMGLSPEEILRKSIANQD